MKLKKIILLLNLILAIYGCDRDISKINLHANFRYITSDSIAMLDTVHFINESENASTYLWYFGDGTTSTEKDPTHSYNNVGNFTVKLVAYNDQDSNSISKYIVIARPKKSIYVTGYIGYGDLALGALIWDNNNCSLLSYQSGSNKATNITFEGDEQYIVGYFNGSYYCKNNKNFVLLNSWDADYSQYKTNTTGIAVLNGTVYISGNDCGSAGLWVNGVQQGINTYSDYATGICVSGNDVFISGNSANNRVSFWKNSVKTEIGDGYSNDITVSNNNIYIVGRSGGKAVYWKNGVLVELPDGIIAKSIMISDQDVYIAGNGTNRAICWKNGIASELTYEDYFTEATAIFIDGDDVYVSGIISKTGWDHKAVYWKNGKCNILPFGESNYSSTDIYVK